MKKIRKSHIFSLILGAIIFGSMGVIAANYAAKDISFTPKDSTWKKSNGEDITNVKDALDDLYTKKANLPIICNYKNSTYGDSNNHLSIGTMYECDPGDSTKRNFYVLEINNKTVDLIMDRNITQGTNKTTYTWNESMKYFVTGNGKNIGWSNVLKIDLPDVQQIANAVSNNNWISFDSDSTWWCFESKKQDVQTEPWCNNEGKYAWLYNYTYNCTPAKCDSNTTLNLPEAVGYWTKNIIKNSNNAWRIDRGGAVGSSQVNSTDHGIRPVITVFKSQLN